MSDPGVLFYFQGRRQHGCLELRRCHLPKSLGDVCVSQKPWLDGLYPTLRSLLFCGFHFSGASLCGLLLASVLTHGLQHLLGDHRRSPLLLQARAMFHSSLLPLLWPEGRQERLDGRRHGDSNLWTCGKYFSQLQRSPGWYDLQPKGKELFHTFSTFAKIY